jgi:hypothetical protein
VGSDAQGAGLHSKAVNTHIWLAIGSSSEANISSWQSEFVASNWASEGLSWVVPVTIGPVKVLEYFGIKEASHHSDPKRKEVCQYFTFV